MPKIQFQGNILLGGKKITIGDLQGRTFEFAERDFNTKATISIEQGRVVVDCDIDQPLTQERLRDTYKHARTVATMVADFVSFAKGWALPVNLDVIVQDNKESLLEIIDPRIESLPKAYRTNSQDFDLIGGLLGGEPTALLALHDLVTSILHPEWAAIHCARAVETLRTLVAGDVERPQAWDIFREKLNLKKEYTQFITKTSEGPRHGDYGDTSLNENSLESMQRAWIIMGRFIEFRKGNNQPLSLESFPML